MIDIGGDFTPLPVIMGGETHVILVGWAGGGMASVTVNGHDAAMDARGHWSSAPLPHRPGMLVDLVFTGADGARSSLRAELPGVDELGPVFGPGWISYAPLT